ncbi:MAG: lytic transglycosylase F [Bacteroidales bacterium]|nr:MAG: lytic transglycosylase F [Bacteroidales bacterium]
MKNTFYIFIVLMLFACGEERGKVSNDLPDILKKGKLSAVTLENSINYYSDDGDESGFDYNLAQNLADHLNLDLKIVVAKSVDEITEILYNGRADISLYKMPTTKMIKQNFIVTNVEALSNMVLIQPLSKKRAKYITDLVDKDIYVHKNSKYHKRLMHLNEEIGGGINIKFVADTLGVEDIIYAVSKGKIPFTVADNDVAELCKKYFTNIDINLAISVVLPKAWVVRRDAPQLDSAVNEWYANLHKTSYLNRMQKKYLEKSNYFDSFSIAVPRGKISSYDELFKANAKIIGWDWRLLAAISYHESRFDPNVVSSNGAVGLMQLMRRTAANYGLNDSTIFIPAENVKVATKYIAYLNTKFEYITDVDERIKFVLASYNCGYGHIIDAIRLAKKYDANPNIWERNVAKYFALLSDADYYNDEIVKLGYFRANHTLRFVKQVLETYKSYLGK